MNDEDVMLQVKLPPKLLDRVDKVREGTGLSRRAIVTALLNFYVRGAIVIGAEWGVKGKTNENNA